MWLTLLFGFREELEKFDENVDVLHEEESFLIYDFSVNVLSFVTKSFTQFFIKACRLEIRNLQDRLHDSQEVVLWDMSGQLFSFHSLNFYDCSDLVPLALIYIVVLVHVLHTVR